MNPLRRAHQWPGTAFSAGFDRARPFPAGAIGLAPALNEPAGFAVDLERVLAGVPRRPLPLPQPHGPGPHARRARGRWPRTPFHLPNSARIWVRDKGRRR